MLPVKQFVEFIEQQKLFGKSDKVLAALSGGMDSVLMVHLLKTAGFNFGIAHCNFQLRGPESTGDEVFCRQLAAQLDVPFHLVHFNTAEEASRRKISVQMAARELRYQWFEDIRYSGGYHAIALAHHQNDTIETILLNLTRGTGIAGLHGILPKSGHLVRPLLFLSRDEIQKLIADNNVGWVEDSSNTSVKYARNKLRLEVIPALKELNPGLEKTFEDNLQNFRELEILLEEKLQELHSSILTNNGGEIQIAISEIKKLKPQRLLLFKLLQPYGFNETTVDDVLASLDKHSGRRFESSSHQLVLDREKLILTQKASGEQGAVTIHSTDHSVVYGNYKLTLLHDDSALIVKDNPLSVSVDADKVQFPLTVRSWQQSDFFYPFGMKVRKKLSDFFINQKVPLHVKADIPLLINGNEEIIWAAGHRLDNRYRVTENTKKVIIFELFKI